MVSDTNWVIDVDQSEREKRRGKREEKKEIECREN